MEQSKIKFLKATWTVNDLSASFVNGVDNFDHNRTGHELPHPDFVKALEALSLDLGRAYYSTEAGIKRYKAKAFVLDERDDIVTIEVKGKLENNFDYLTNVSSGKLLLEKALKKRYETLCTELYLYFFENKTAQLEIDFKKAAGNDS
jgi:hypothetical protein